MILLAIAHSIIGERLIFDSIKRGRKEHDRAIALLTQRRWDSLWSTWHLVSVIGAGLGAALIAYAVEHNGVAPRFGFLGVIATTFGFSTVFWLFGTRGRHPAWIVMSAITILIVVAIQKS
jgi:hypothetical protein